MAVFSVIKLSELEGAKRIDAEYYKPEYLEVRNKLSSISTKEIKDISKSVVSFGAYSLCNYISFQKEGIPYLNVENIKEGYIDWSDIKYIDPLVHKLLWKSKVREGQVILTMAGTIGNATVAYKVPSELNSNQATAKITLKKGFSPFYLAVFLNSFYGKIQTKWEIVSNVQPNIFLWQIKRIKVFVPKGHDLIEKIEKLYKNGLGLLSHANLLYSQAENLFLEELGLKDFKPKYEKTYTAKLSFAFSAHRIDAEYFQPAYEEVIEKLRENNIELQPLRKFILSIQKGIEPGSENYQDEGKPFIRVSNLSKYGFTDRDQKYLSEELYLQLRETYEPKQGDFLLTKDATPGIAYVVKEQIEGIISSGILRLQINENEIDKEYLALCINSIIGKMQVERDCGGSVILHWKPEQVKRLQIPLLPLSIQQEIASLVQQSHEARKKAKELLEIAKKAVEIAIEEGEEKAVNYILKNGIV
jgi:type I restriction enzyme S subunit